MYLKNYSFKVPHNISIYYSRKKTGIVFKTQNRIKLLLLGKNLIFIFIKNNAYILTNFGNRLSNITIKKSNHFKKQILAHFKTFLIETQGIFYTNLKLEGIGYKIFSTDYNNILLFKLGYTHAIFFKLNLKFFIYKNVKLFINHGIYKDITNASSLVKLLKWPEPYKGKGIVFSREKIKLKIGKKV